MSERPQSIATGMVDSSISIGNYKGVMLCNRPFAGAAGGAAAAAASGGSKMTFACGTVPEDLGLNRKRSEVVAVKRTKKETALTRHRKWLADLQRTNDQLKKASSDEAAAKEDSQRRFMEREAKMRSVARASNAALVSEAKSGAPEETAAAPPPMAEAKGGEDDAASETKASAKADDKESSTVNLDAVAKRRAKQGQAAKPRWAMTEDKAQEADLDLEEFELDGLLDFAKNLDYDKYIDDMEVATMMETVKARIAELEAAADDDEEFERFEQSTAAKGGKLTAGKIEALQRKFGVSSSEEKKDDDDETKSVAMSVLSENRGLGAIHSRKSVEALAAASQRKKGGTETAPFGLDMPLGTVSEFETAKAAPVISTHTDDQGSRMANKQTVQNLPYMNRNPAV